MMNLYYIILRYLYFSSILTNYRVPIDLYKYTISHSPIYTIIFVPLEFVLIIILEVVQYTFHICPNNNFQIIRISNSCRWISVTNQIWWTLTDTVHQNTHVSKCRAWSINARRSCAFGIKSQKSTKKEKTFQADFTKCQETKRFIRFITLQSYTYIMIKYYYHLIIYYKHVISEIV